MNRSMKLNGQQRTILREGILGAYPSEDELKILLLEKMNLNLEEFNRGESYNPKISNLIIHLPFYKLLVTSYELLITNY